MYPKEERDYIDCIKLDTDEMCELCGEYPIVFEIYYPTDDRVHRCERCMRDAQNTKEEIEWRFKR